MQQCCSSLEFKQQTIDDTLINSYESVAAIAHRLGVSYLTLDKWFCEANPAGSSKSQLLEEQQYTLDGTVTIRHRW